MPGPGGATQHGGGLSNSTDPLGRSAIVGFVSGAAAGRWMMTMAMTEM
jgi:hypothetical protein